MKAALRTAYGLLLLSVTVLASCQFAGPSPTEAWQAKRLGMFIHWGPVAQKGTEIGWSRGGQVPVDEYDQLYKTFNPTGFDADAWTDLAKDAGMQYLVITAKHHDGFCLWPSQFTDYDIANTPYKLDVLAQLKVSCREKGIELCAYYSLCDWYHPDYPLGSPRGKTSKPSPDMPRYFDYVSKQTAELIENYGPLGLIWFDGEWEEPWTDSYGSKLYTQLKTLQPSLLINNRIGKGRQGLTGTTVGSETAAGDFDTPERQIGAFQRDRPWESCITLCHQWSWKPDDEMKSLKQCIHTLLQVIGGDGNLLLNIGPRPDGTIEPRQVVRLKEFGAWVQRYSEGIHGTRGGPFKPGAWGASTCKGNKIYLYVTQWPEKGALNLPQLGVKITKVRTLSGGEASLVSLDRAIQIGCSNEDRGEIATVIELTVDGDAFGLHPLDVARALPRGNE